MPYWEEIEKTMEFVWKVTPAFDIDDDDDVLFDEFVCIIHHSSPEKFAE
jgi:hypothetical protein